MLIAYLAPTERQDPFASSGASGGSAGPRAAAELGGLLDAAELGPRSSHEPGRGAETLEAYAQWVGRAGGASLAAAFRGDDSWDPRAPLRPALRTPGDARLLARRALRTALTLGRLGLYEIQADSLELGVPRAATAEDPTVLAAKRGFGIGDPLLLERRAAALAEAAGVPIEALDLALANWGAPQRATLGFPQGRPTGGPGGPGVGAIGPGLGGTRRAPQKSRPHGHLQWLRQSTSSREPRCHSASFSPRTRSA